MRLGVMCSGIGTNFENIVRTCTKHEVVLMIHNKKECGAIKRANKLGIPHCRISAKDEDQMILLFQAWRVDLIVLAGYMRVLSSDFIKAFPDKIINVHPSLLPNYPGLNTHARAIAGLATEHGASVHFVTPELDAGPIVIQGRGPVLPSDTPESLAQRVHQEEYQIYPRAITWFAQNRLSIEGDRVLLDELPVDIRR